MIASTREAAQLAKFIRRRKICKINRIENHAGGWQTLPSWSAACTLSGVRVSLKSATAAPTAQHPTTAKSSSDSFFDALSRASSGGVQSAKPASTGSQSGSNSGAEDEQGGVANASPKSAFQMVADETECGTAQQAASATAAIAATVQNHQSVSSSTSRLLQRCQVRPSEPDAQSTAASSEGGSTATALLSVPQQEVTAQQNSQQAGASTTSENSQPANNAASSSELLAGLAAIQVINGHQVAARNSNDSASLPDVTPTHTNAAPQTASSDNAGQSNISADESQQLSGATATAQMLAQEFSLPASLGAGNTFFQGGAVHNNGSAINFSAKTGLTTMPTSSTLPSAAGRSVTDTSTDSRVATKDAGVSGGAQNIGQSPLHIQAADSVIAIPNKTPDGSSAQSFVSVGSTAQGTANMAHVLSQRTEAAPVSAQSPADPSDQLDGATSGTSGINTAQLVQSMSESEMRLGMHSAEFGDIDIRTSVTQQQVHAQISVDHTALGSAIAAHLPSLQAKLGNDSGLQTSIHLNQGDGSLTGGLGHASQQNLTQFSHSIATGSSNTVAETDSLAIPVISLSAVDGRLDIQA